MRKVKIADITSERHIQDACSDLLALDGWRMLRTDPVSEASFAEVLCARIAATPQLAPLSALIRTVVNSCLRGKGFGELGMADCLYIRYLNGAVIECPTMSGSMITAVLKRPAAEVMWVEYKKLKEKAQAHQTAWKAAEWQRGAKVVTFGEDFPATIESFCDWYLASGLARNKSPFLQILKRSS